jgi:putative ABC transport system permease protein
MIDLDKWQEIGSMLMRHKLRTLLTAFGVFWGIFMLVTLLGAGNGFENGVKRMFDRQENVVFVWASKTTMPYAGLPIGREIRMTDAEVAAIANTIDEVALVAPGNFLGSPLIKRGAKSDTLEVRGAHPEALTMRPLDVVLGRFINEIDMNERRKVAVIGPRARRVLFKEDENPVGAYIQIYNVFFQVVGVLDSRQMGDDSDDDDMVLLPNTTIRHTFNMTDRVHQLMILPKPGVRGELVEKKVKALLQERLKIHPEDPRAVLSFSMQKEFEKVQGLHQGIRIFSWLVAIGTILAGAIGVGNVMLIVVKERTREIGIRKALGARPASIVSMIVQESLAITAISGYMGLIVGVILLETINRVLSSMGSGNRFFTNPEISFGTAISAIIVLMLAGLLAALLPAVRAASIDPIVALQEE